MLPGCVPHPLSLESRRRGRTKRGIMLACRLMMVVTIPEDSLVGGKTFPTAKSQVSVGSSREAQHELLVYSLLLQAEAALHVVTPTGLLCRSFAIGTGLCELGEVLLGALDRFFVSPFLVFVPFNTCIPFVPRDLMIETTPESTGIASHNRGFRYKAIRYEYHNCQESHPPPSSCICPAPHAAFLQFT